MNIRVLILLCSLTLIVNVTGVEKLNFLNLKVTSCYSGLCEKELNECQSNQKCQQWLKVCAQKFRSELNQNLEEYDKCMQINENAKIYWDCFKANCLPRYQ